MPETDLLINNQNSLSPSSTEAIPIWLHPDSLNDEEYEQHWLDPSEYQPLSAKWQQERAADSQKAVRFRSERDDVMQTSLVGDDMFRLRIVPESGFLPKSTTEELGLVDTNKPTSESLHTTETGNDFRVTGGGFDFRFDPESNDFLIDIDGETTLESSDGGARFSPRQAEYGGHRLFASFKLAEDEQIWGFGGRVRPLNRRGQSIDVFSVKTGRNVGDYGGFPIPFFISSRGYGVFLNNPWPHVYFDMGQTTSDRWFVNSPGGEFDLFIIRGASVAEIVRRFTSLVGRIDLPQKFLFGFWVSSLAFETGEQLLDVAERLRKEQYPCDNLVLDGPWRGGPEFIPHYQKYREYMNNDLEWHPDFGDGPTMMRKLHNDDYKVALHLNSRIFTKETAADALARGLLRQHEEEVVPKLEDEAGERFFLDHLAPRIEEGVDLWWTDHTDRVGGEIKPGVPSRNLFGPLWNRLLARAMADYDKGERLSLSRGGGIGSQRYALPWPGDTASGLNRFAEDIWFCLNAGLAGFPITSVDMGGFTMPRTDMTEEEEYECVFGKENLHRRLFQSIMFIPAPRIHSNYLGLPRLPWNCPEASRDLYRQFLQERYRLTPYFYSLGLVAAETGEPIMRPLFYHFTDDPKTHEVSSVFTVGESLLMAPVVEAGAENWSFYLPNGQWYDYWTGELIEGGREIQRPCPIDKLSGLPMLVRAGSIIPLQEPSLSLDQSTPTSLSLAIYPDAEGRASLSLREQEDVCNQFSFVSRDKDKEGGTLSLSNQTGRSRRYQAFMGNNPKFSSEVLECTLATGEEGKLNLGEG